MSLAPSMWELAAQHYEKNLTLPKTPLDLAQHLDHRVSTSPELNLINDALVRTLNKRDGRLIIHLPPQRGKSQIASRWFPLWALTQNPDLRCSVASYEANIARRWGRTVRDDITQYQDKLNIEVRQDLSAQNEWQLKGRDGGMFTVGVGGAMTGRSVDLLVVDDPIKGRAEASSQVFQDRTWSWWTDVAMTRLSPGAPVVIIATRWDVNDLTGKLLEQDPDSWEYLRIPAQADHSPDNGETDPLGREPGEYLTDVRGTTDDQWETIKQASGPKTWQSLYQGKPTLEKGGIFPADIPTFNTPIWVNNPDGTKTIPGMDRTDQQLIISWDLAFKGGVTSDYVVGQVWLRIGANAYLVDQYRAQADFTTSLQAVQDLKNRWPQATAILVEDKANGPAVLNSLQNRVPGLIPIEPDGGKQVRAHAVSPFFYAGNVHFPSSWLLPNVQDLREEMINFGAGSGHDDTIDAMTQAINQLLGYQVQNPHRAGPLEEIIGGFHISDY